jgi:molecular chaperone DnaK (HSP70)
MFRRPILGHVRSSHRRKGHHPFNVQIQSVPCSLPWLHQHHNEEVEERKKRNAFQIIRSYHATRPQEILPLLVVGGALFLGRYSYKALNRMEDEWEEYQWELLQYERATVRQAESISSLPTTIGVDLGTIYLKLAHAHKDQPQPQLVVTSQGDRYRFQGVVLVQEQQEDEDEDVDVITGRPALEKFLYKNPHSTAPESVVLPFQRLSATTTTSSSSGTRTNKDSSRRMAQQVILPAVREAMDRVARVASRPSEEHQSEDASSQLVRTVLTLPPNLYRDHAGSIFQNYPLQKENAGNTCLVIPDPVAAIWGAQALDLLAVPSTKEEAPMILVVDVGGLTMTLSMVQRDVVLASSTIDQIGGETYVQQLMQRIVSEAATSSSTTTTTSSSMNLENDAICLALIQQQARTSVMELVQKKQAKVHIPFLFMGRRPDNPHMDMTISRSTMEQDVQDYIRESVISKLLAQHKSSSTSSLLSQHMPTPTDLKSLITSTAARLLEHSRTMPSNITHILLVGGGARHELFVTSCHEGLWALMGPALPQKFVLPDAAVRSELVALGAASLLPNYTYSAESGLSRIQ